MPPIIVDNTSIPYNHVVKFLGLLLDSKLSWKPHIQSVRSKLSSACGVFYQIRSKINISIAKTIYYTIAFPYLNYCCTAWSSAHTSHLQILSSTQRRLIRLIMKRGRRTETNLLFKQLRLLKTSDIFKLNCLLFVYKSINRITVSPIVFNEQVDRPYNLRARPQLSVPRHTSKQSERFIEISGAKLWNNIPENIQNSQSVNSFKRRIKKIFWESYV